MLNKTAIVKSFLVASIISASCAATAADMYAGGGVAVLDADEVTLNAVYGRFGAFFNENISAEARLGLGVGDDSTNYEGFDVKAELDNYYGIYLRGGIPAGEVFYPYAVLGYTKAKVTATASAFGQSASASESDSDLSYGVGADFAVTESLKINAEYMSYLDKDESELTGFSVGVAFSF